MFATDVAAHSCSDMQRPATPVKDTLSTALELRTPPDGPTRGAVDLFANDAGKGQAYGAEQAKGCVYSFRIPALGIQPRPSYHNT